MAVFLVVPLGENYEQLSERVFVSIADGDRYALPNSAGWLISYKGTTVELSALLEITGQREGQRSPVGATIISPITSYYGRGPTDMWEWLKVKMEAAQ